jgi:hypothetical protein
MFTQRVIRPDERLEHINNLEKNGYTVIKSYISDLNVIAEVENLKKLHKLFFSATDVINSSSPQGLQRIISNDQVVNNVFHFEKKYIQLATTGDHLTVMVELNDEQLSKNQKLILGLYSRPSLDPFSSPSLRKGYKDRGEK